jgi:FkbM family methyltransferase
LTSAKGETAVRFGEGPGVVLDVQPLQNPHSAERGIGRYLAELIKALHRWAPGAIGTCILNPDLPLPSSVDWLAAAAPVSLSDRKPPERARVFHVPSLFEPVPLHRIWPKALRGLRLVVTLHDLIPFIFTDRYLLTPDERRWYHTRLQMLRQADRVLAVSEATARDAIERLGIPSDRVIVTGEAAPEIFEPAADRAQAFEELRRHFPSLRAGYVLYPGGMDPRKNLDALLDAYAGLPASLRTNHQLVVLGALSPAHRRLLEKRTSDLGITGDTWFPGYVPDDVLLRLYQAAKLSVFPSLYEGFGLPIVEAMACRTPVLAAATSSLLELVTNKEALFDPHDVNSIRSAIEQALTDVDLLARLSLARLDERHSWHEVAGRTARAYEDVASGHRLRLSPRPRVAFAAPGDGRESTGDDAIIDALLERCDVDLLVAEGRDAEVQPGVHVRRLARVGEVLSPGLLYDLVLLRVNEARRLSLPPSVLQASSAVLAHDVALGGLAHLFTPSADDDGPPVDSFRPTRQIIKSVDVFAVESRYAEQLARLCAEPPDEAKVVRIPYGYPLPDGGSEGRRPGLIATFGLGKPIRGLAYLLQAFGEVVARRDDAELVLVGSLPRGGRRIARGLISELGLGEQVRLVENDTNETTSQWLHRAAVAVQVFETPLQASTEASIAPCLAAGVPTIATDVGAIREVPAQCIVKLNDGSDSIRLAGLIVDLLADEPRQRSLRLAGLVRAEEHSPARAATALCAALAPALGLDRPREKNIDRPSVQDAGEPLRELLSRAELDVRVADVGCRWGFHERWDSLEPNVELIGFEPDVAEAERLQGLYRGERVTIAAHALGKDEGIAILHIARDPGSSSLYQPAAEVLRGRPELSRIERVEDVSVELTTLDAWTGRTGLGPIHVLKLDVQGAELDVLEGTVEQLATVRLVESEVEFNPMYYRQPLYADVDRFLRDHGFVLWRLGHLVHYDIAGHSSDFIAEDEQVFENRSVRFPAEGGQLFWGHAYYVPKELAFGTGGDWRDCVRDAAITWAYSFLDLARQSLTSAAATCPDSMTRTIARVIAALPSTAATAS